MKTLVTIFNYNLPDITDQLFEALKPYGGTDYDLVVLDNGSKPEGKSKYTTHETEQNCYFGGAFNLAMQLFKEDEQYDSTLILSNDIILHGYNYVKELRRIMFEQDYTILSSCVLQPEKDQCNWKYMHNWGSTKVRDVKWIDFQAPMIHRRFLDVMPQFPEELILGWGQDVLSGIVCEENNWKIGVVDWLPLIHFSAFTYRSGKAELTVSEYAQNAERAMFSYFMNNKLDKFNKFRTLSANYKYK